MLRAVSRDLDKHYQASLLAKIAELDAAHPSSTFPLAQIMPSGDDRAYRDALRSLYKAGLIRGVAGHYGITAQGRRTYTLKRIRGVSNR